MKPMRTVSEWLESWLVWLPVTGIAWTVSLVLAMLTALGLGGTLPQAATWAVAGIAGGALLGLVQWLALRPQTRAVGMWMLATGVGWVAGLVVAALPVKALYPTWGRLVGALLGGLLLGCTQWLSLRREAHGTTWLVMTSAGWSAAIAVSLMIDTQGWDMFGGGILAVAVSVTLGLVLLALIAVPARALLFPELGRREPAGYERWWP